MNRPAVVVLIGPMAAGKTHVGRRLAERHPVDFVDADHEFERRHGSIPDFFRRHGEPAFRAAEAEIVSDLLGAERERPVVLGLGGGAPMTPAVARAIAEHTVVYVCVDLQTVRPRIAGNTTRPMLQPDPEARWQEILEQRADTYEHLAHVRLDATGARTVDELADELWQRLGTVGREEPA